MKNIICLLILSILVSGCGKTISVKEPEKPVCEFSSLSEEQQEQGCKKYCQDSPDFVSRRNSPIDIEERKCIQESYMSDIKMGDCAYTAMDAWYLEIEKNLKTLKSMLTPEQYKLVEISQKNWERYIKSEFELKDKVIFYKIGTIYYAMNAAEKVALVRNRALDLKEYIYYINEP